VSCLCRRLRILQSVILNRVANEYFITRKANPMLDPHGSVYANQPRDVAPPAVTYSTEAVVSLLARSCRATCGEFGEGAKIEAARLFFTTTVLALRELDPKTDTIVRRLAHERLRVVSREHPAALRLKEDASDPWHCHFLLLSSDITLQTYVGRAIARHGDNNKDCGVDPELFARITAS
jgi:hypothetical protein